MLSTRRSSLFGMAMPAALAALLVSPAVLAQQGYPNKPIRFVTPYAAGGSTSIVARMIGEKYTEAWGQQVLIDSRGGGNTIIGTDFVAKAPPDGYTIIYTAMTHVVIPQLLPAPYDPLRDFAAVASTDNAEELLVVHPSFPANTLKEFIALARAKPGQINYASAGSGGANHLAGEFFNELAGVKLQHIPYKGAAPAIADLLGGQVQSSFVVPINAISHVRAGKLRALAVSGNKRMSSLPNLPTFTEAGLPGYDAGFWRGILAPAGTPRAIIDRLSAETAKIIAMPDIREKLTSQGLDPYFNGPEQFSEMMRADATKYGKIIKVANIRIDQ